ncbi:HTH-type transcriptional regulator McbR [Roseivivax sp. THAF40]|uniref:GntR family transcriptional regulator n=1 Tax=unclassified Roseivivax TaxID=2639302 RepID=UPI0012689533|nr:MULTISPECIES: GntR family transcriptional regulator [unclassified Roseivivax]QFS84501.1 HTH-type transcriptional regulator McbR [Roseivivax sp. THAF197b]QFT48329.1 HTH-type transcriptional regulator McbR [Roseivivax sp. THAF40]
MSDAETRHLRLYETLRTRICLLDYPPGTKLGEEALAAEFGVSRTPLRRVLSRLADEGLLETRHGVGTLVTDVEPLELAHIYALRMELAELTGRLSPCEITPDMLAKARAFADEADALQAAPDPRAFAELNLAFFTFGLSLTENTPLAEISERLYLRTARIWLARIPSLDLARECEIFAAEVRETLAALEAGDAEAAGLVRRAHVSMSYGRLTG